jgi:DNA-binding transcriptional regulator YiaG
MAKKQPLSLEDYIITKNGEVFNKKNGHKLKPQINGTGYYRVGIGGKLCFVHRLVAKLYIPNPENKPQVNHKDGNKLNNNVDNLECVTNKENTIHAIKTGLQPIEEKSKVAKLKRSQVQFIKSHDEMTRKELADLFNISENTISDIRNGKTWKTVEKIC